MASQVAAASRSTLEHGFVVAHDAEIDCVASGIAHGTQQHRAIALADLAGLQWRAVVDQFVAGGEHSHSRPWHHRDDGRIDAGQHTGHCRGDERAGRVQRRTGPHVVAHATHGDADRHRPPHPHSHATVDSAVTEQLGVLHHHDGIGARRHRGTGHDANRLTRLQHPVGVRTGRHLADDRQLDRGSGHGGGDHRVTIDGAVGERGHVLRGHHRCRQHQAGGFAARHVDRHRRRAAGEHVGAGLGDVDHAATVP